MIVYSVCSCTMAAIKQTSFEVLLLHSSSLLLLHISSQLCSEHYMLPLSAQERSWPVKSSLDAHEAMKTVLKKTRIKEMKEFETKGGMTTNRYSCKKTGFTREIKHNTNSSLTVN